MTQKAAGTDYLHLRAWNTLLGSTSEAFNLDRARRDNAPADVIYYGSEGWVSFGDGVPNTRAAEFVRQFVAKRQGR